MTVDQLRKALQGLEGDKLIFVSTNLELSSDIGVEVITESNDDPTVLGYVLCVLEEAQ